MQSKLYRTIFEENVKIKKDVPFWGRGQKWDIPKKSNLPAIKNRAEINEFSPVFYNPKLVAISIIIWAIIILIISIVVLVVFIIVLFIFIIIFI